jgi:hypothetical protein
MRVPLVNFSKGVLSRRLLQRGDVDAYRAGMLRGDNVVVLKYGGFSIRPGWRYIDDCQGEGEVLFPFSFSFEQTYALAMGQGYMQPLALGGFVLEDELAIAGATNADPVVLEVAYHGYEVGDRLFVPAGSVAGMTELNGKVWEVTGVPDDDHIEIDADGTGWGVFTGSTGGVTNSAPPPPPPPPPPVPPAPPPPPPPNTGGGGGGGGGWRENEFIP